MFEILDDEILGPRKPDTVDATFFAHQPTAMRDGEKTVFLTSKDVYRATLEAGSGAGPAPFMALIQAYLRNGGVVWVCGACSRTGTLYGRAVRVERNASGSSMGLGAEYIARDIVDYFHRQAQEATGSDKIGREVPVATIVDPWGKRIDAVLAPVKADAVAGNRHGIPQGTVNAPTGRRKFPLANRFVLERSAASSVTGTASDRSGVAWLSR